LAIWRYIERRRDLVDAIRARVKANRGYTSPRPAVDQALREREALLEEVDWLTRELEVCLACQNSQLKYDPATNTYTYFGGGDDGGGEASSASGVGMCLSTETRTTHLKDIESTLQHVPTEKLSCLVPDKLLEPHGSTPEAALMKELVPTLTPDAMYAALKETAIDMDDPSTGGFDTGFDFGTGLGLAASTLTA